MAPKKKAVPAPKVEPTAEERLDAIGIEWVCDQICACNTQTAIANTLQVGIATLCRWIASDLERSARVREARIAAARTFDDMAEQALMDAKDPFGLAKARELASHYRWKASKFSPREFGEKIEIENRTTITDLTDDQLNARLAELTAAGAAAGDAGADGGKGPA